MKITLNVPEARALRIGERKESWLKDYVGFPLAIIPGHRQSLQMHYTLNNQMLNVNFDHIRGPKSKCMFLLVQKF